MLLNVDPNILLQAFEIPLKTIDLYDHHVSVVLQCVGVGEDESEGFFCPGGFSAPNNKTSHEVLKGQVKACLSLNPNV